MPPGMVEATMELVSIINLLGHLCVMAGVAAIGFNIVTGRWDYVVPSAFPLLIGGAILFFGTALPSLTGVPTELPSDIPSHTQPPTKHPNGSITTWGPETERSPSPTPGGRQSIAQKEGNWSWLWYLGGGVSLVCLICMVRPIARAIDRKLVVGVYLTERRQRERKFRQLLAAGIDPRHTVLGFSRVYRTKED